ncbi:MAG: LptF/LptG family permease [Planctomycetes bacterium]|nr:LptF/LptG family permease [Planctomycetota bacterium]
MRTLDRYILRSFLYSYLLCFLVMMGLRIVSDLFVNMDEFSELPIRGPQLVLYVVQYYAFNSLIYFQEMSGVILVAAAAFSLARMNHTNELVAVLASGVSLHRVVLPVALAAVLLASVGVVNREQLIPRVKDRLVRDRDDAPGESDYPVHLVVDDERNVWYSRTFRDRRDEQWMVAPLIICRDRQLRQTAKVAGLRATWRDGWWRVTDATVALLTRGGRRGGVSSSFIWTPRSPQVLAAGGKGTIGPADRIRIDYESLDRTADPQNPWLNRPRFEILAPPAIDAPPQTPPRVLATIAAVQAWYGPAAGGRGESGYHLLGPAELRDTDVRDYRPLAKALARWAREPDGSIEQRLWSLLPAAARADIEAIAAEPDAARNPARRQRIFGALAALVDGPLLARPADAGDGRFDLPPVDRTAVASGEASSAEQVRRINRLVLDGLAGPWLVGTQGILRMPTSLTPDDIRLRRDSAWMEYMSSREIGRLLREGQIPDVRAAQLIRHSRVAAPVVEVIMLLLCVPFIVSRDRHIKTSALLAVAVVGGFHVFVFGSRYLGAEMLGALSAGLTAYGAPAPAPVWGPILAAMLPIVAFAPVAILLLMSMESMEPSESNRTLGQILTTAQGRLDRRTFWLTGVPPAGGLFAAALLIDALWIRRPGLITWAAVAAVAWPSLAMLIKRCHDRGRPGTFLLVLAAPAIAWLWMAVAGHTLLVWALSVPVIGWVAVDLLVLPGTAGPNTYGPERTA